MKKLFVTMLLALPLMVAAQEVKIAVVNTLAVFNLMPEVAELENEIATKRQKAEKEMKSLQEEYERKYSDYVAKQDSLDDNIKKTRIQEIQDIESRMETFRNLTSEDLQKTQSERVAPIQEKLRKAIKDVSDENGYTYVLDAQALLYQSPNAIDATEKVKAKLGLK
ncbi:MAG: OmpH family outer membrane protein [Tannerella sp.]|jgi:outer membrane protein|nr:OmpH family outer membrane protein [Tannerella sp.]